MLKDVVNNPFVPLTDRYERFSSTYKGHEAKDELVEKGVVVEQQVQAQPGKRKLLELTERGREYLKNNHDLDAEQKGRGGIVHRYWQHRIRDAFDEAGWTAEVEVFDADVYINMHELELAVEVAMGNNKREIEHVKQRLERGFTAVWVACRDEGVRDELRRRLEENDLVTDRVAFRLFRDFTDIQLDQ